MVKAEMMSGSGSGKVVCVTGASGFIASWLVKLLLQRGYTVHGTVMDLTNPKETIHLQALDGAIERLHLYKANLLEEGSFDAAIKGCEGVFHTASPCFHETLNPQMDLIDPTMKGTLNVLASCKKFSVKRVVVTSSMAAVSQNCRPKTPDVVVDETWFSDLDYCQERKLWYMVAKTMAEDALWKFSRENGVEIVTIHPSVTIGPLLQPILNESASFLLKLLNGASSVFPYGTCGWVHVQDVAMAHILAFEVSSAAGRYCLAERVAHYAQIVDIIHGLYPSFKLADKCADNKSFIPMYQVSKEKAKSLGIDFIPLERGIMEMIQSLKEKGFFSA